MNNFYIYMYLDSQNIPFYIGKGSGDRYKIIGHISTINQSAFLKNKINKIGRENVRIYFLHINLTEEKAFQWEKYWINYIGRRDKKEGTLCNLTDGGDGVSGFKHSDETKRKIGIHFKGKSLPKETKLKVSNTLKGRVFTEEWKQKISKNKKGIQIPEERKERISKTLLGHIRTEESKRKESQTLTMYWQDRWNKRKFTRDSELIIIYQTGISIKEIANIFKINASTVYDCLKKNNISRNRKPGPKIKKKNLK